METKYNNVYINPTIDEMANSGLIHQSIAFDLDSVLNEGAYLRNYVATWFGTTVEEVMGKSAEGHEIFQFNIPGVSYKEMGLVVNKCIREESPSAFTTPYMVEVLRYVYEVTGKPILVVTARHPSNTGVTSRWLDEHLAMGGIPYVCYIMNGVPKAPALHMHGVSIFIDDRHKTIKGLMDQIPYPVIFKRPWNQDRPDALGVLEINDLRDIIPLLNVNLGVIPTAWPSGLPHPTGGCTNHVSIY